MENMKDTEEHMFRIVELFWEGTKMIGCVYVAVMLIKTNDLTNMIAAFIVLASYVRGLGLGRG